jgi:uncharacterized protein YdeI (YjbR/CyaY-like superfamily)
MAFADAPTIAFESKAAFRAWIDANQGDADGLWLKLAKKDSGIPSLTYAEALDVALCFGWIDGQKRPFDETYWLQRFTPRRARSKWSKINIGKVEALIASEEMTPAGIAEVDRAKADGRWEAAYESQSNATFPADFLEALHANPKAAATFETITRSSKYAIIYRLGDAKRPETRQRRLEQFIAQLAAGEQPHPPIPGKKSP